MIEKQNVGVKLNSGSNDGSNGGSSSGGSNGGSVSCAPTRA